MGGFGFVLYFAFIVGLTLALINVIGRVADSAFTGLAIEGSATSKSSRIKTGLEAQERAAKWRSADYALERPPVPDVSVAALAKGLDAAEDHPLPPHAKT